MRILLTGASGFLGRALARRLGAEHEVVGTFLGHSDPVPGCRLVRLDVADPAACQGAVHEARPRLVIHAAALSKPDICERELERTEAVNVGGTAALANAAAAGGARFLFFSSDQVHDGRGSLYPDDAPPTPLSAYGRQKARAELAALAGGGDALVLRLALCYGWAPPGGVPTMCDDLRAALREKRPFKVFTDQRRSLLYVEDAAELVARAAAMQEPPPEGRRLLNLAGPEPVTRHDFAAAFCDVMGLDAHLLVPIRAAEAPMTAPRPLDCSLDGKRLWSWLGFRPGAARAGLERMKREPARV